MPILPVKSSRCRIHSFQKAAVLPENDLKVLLKISPQKIQYIMPGQPGIHRRKPQSGHVFHPVMPRNFLPDLRPVQVDHMQFRIGGTFRAFPQQEMTDIAIAVVQAGTVHLPGHLSQFPDQGAFQLERRRLEAPIPAEILQTDAVFQFIGNQKRAAQRGNQPFTSVSRGSH